MSEAPTWADLPLAHHHADQLQQSGIAPAVAAQRGYRTATTVREVKRLGFAESQCLVPGLLIPVHGVGGDLEGYQFKPDAPRTRDGKVHKYEQPARSASLLDVPIQARRWVMDPEHPLVFTEGAKKADAGASRELAVVAVAGVWNWRSEAVIASLDQIPLKGRTVYLCFDSDWRRNPRVRAALKRLAAVLRSRGAIVYALCLPETVPGEKVGLDDYLAAGHGAIDLFSRVEAVELTEDADADEAAEASMSSGAYVTRDGRTCWRKRERDGDVEIPLAEFSARIAEEVIADDGLTERGEYVVVGALPDGTPLPPVRVPLGSFDGMGWVGRTWGSRAIVSAGMGAKDRLREAIQRLSPDTVRRREFTHPGWRRIDGAMHFLHAGGAIGAGGAVSVDQVRLSGAAGRLRLPDPPEGEALRDAVRTALGVRDVAPDRITAPLLGMVYRAPLNAVRYADLAGWLTGPTGAGKSELSAVAQAHFGDFDRLSLPASWAATPNYLERVAFDFKDCLLTIDDFAPSGSTVDVARLHATAERVIRGAGNAAGRGRMNADGSLRPDYQPRALILGTGEDVPKGQSIRARTVVMEAEPGDVDWARLAAYQVEEGRAALPLAMAGYLRWLAGRFEALRDELPALVARFRRELVAAGRHARTPEAIANLAVGWFLWLRFAHEVGALSREESEAAWGRAWQALAALACDQMAYHADEDPAERFVALFRSAIASGAAHVASPNGGEPIDPAAWGWRFRVVGAGLSERSEWQPCGVRVGWLAGDDLYLDPAASYAAAQRLGTSGAGGLTVSARTVHKRLHQAGYLRTVDQARGRLTVRVSLRDRPPDDHEPKRDRRVEVLHLAASALLSGKPSQPSQPLQGREKSQEPPGDRAGERWDGFPGDGTETSQPDGNRPTFGNGNCPAGTGNSAHAGPIGTVGTDLQTEMVWRRNGRTDPPESDPRSDPRFARAVAEAVAATPEEFAAACAEQAWYAEHELGVEDGPFIAAVLAEASRLRATAETVAP